MIRKTALIARISARHRLSQRAALVGRIGTCGVLLFVFSQLWGVIGRAYASVPSARVVWYIAITEWIVLSLPPVHEEVQDELRSGDLLYRLTRPLAYPSAKLAEAIGELIVRLAVLAAAAGAFAYAFTGAIALEPRALVWVLSIGVLAAITATAFGMIVGLSAFWLHDCRPIYWVWQKGLFLLGGLLVPLELYPSWLRDVARWTPFSAILNGPASLAFGDGAPALVALRLVAWLAVALAAIAIVFRLGLRHIDGGGG
jgi:ABC-2 type transport system permease protein